MNSTASISEVKKLLARYQLYPKKKWGQNFLIDANILNKIVAGCNLNVRTDYVIEIGPGIGALTSRLAPHCKGLLAIDIDTSLELVLKETLHGINNIKLVFSDVLQTNIEKQIQEVFGLPQVPEYKVCANIPYNITSPIIFHLLENNHGHMAFAVLMMQKEVAQRIMARPGGKDYGLLTIMTSYYADVEMVMPVSHNCFYPRPDVDSMVIKITPLPNKRVLVEDEQVFKGFLRSAFQKRRKTMLNICTDYFGINKSEVQSRLEAVDLAPQLRPENLTIEDFASIIKVLTVQEDCHGI